MGRATKVFGLICAAALGATATRCEAQNVKPINLVPGEQILARAELPAQVGDGGDRTDRLSDSKTETLDYWLFIPSDESAKTDDGFPLLLFLHGAGERGDDPELVKKFGPAKYCADPETSKTWKFITVSPQCKDLKRWSPLQLAELIKKICDERPVDRSRIYVTGMSMGGYATWGLASILGDKIAAIAPVCGWFPKEKASTIVAPVWAFHGADDDAISVDDDREIVDAVRAAGNRDVIFTVYPGVKHDSWTQTYSNPLLYDWLLSRSVPPTIDGPKPVAGKQALMAARLPKNVRQAFGGDDQISSDEKETVKFWLFQPSDESAKNESGFPLLLFLHGMGECGDAPDNLKRYGPPKLCDDPDVSRTWKFFTISPQNPRFAMWSPLQLATLVDEVCKKYPIDRRRIYATGVSLGGMGTWELAATCGEKFAAVAPVCGNLDPKKGGAIKTPVWAFHGAVDPIVKLETDQAIVDAVKNAGNEDVQLTVYPGVGHDCWNLAYDEQKLYQWFLSKSLSATEDSER